MKKVYIACLIIVFSLAVVALVRVIIVEEKFQDCQNAYWLKVQNRDVVFLMGKNLTKSGISDYGTSLTLTDEKEYEWVQVSIANKKVYLEGLECELLTPIKDYTSSALSYLRTTLEKQEILQHGEFSKIIDKIANNEDLAVSSCVYAFKSVAVNGVIFYEDNTIYILYSVFGHTSVTIQTASVLFS